jgi:hypothetical protein
VNAAAENRENEAKSEAELFAAHGHLPAPTLVGEFVSFLRHNKKWWLTPILLILVLVGLLVSLGGTAAAPWIYSLF